MLFCKFDSIQLEPSIFISRSFLFRVPLSLVFSRVDTVGSLPFHPNTAYFSFGKTRFLISSDNRPIDVTLTFFRISAGHNVINNISASIMFSEEFSSIGSRRWRGHFRNSHSIGSRACRRLPSKEHTHTHLHTNLRIVRLLPSTSPLFYLIIAMLTRQ